MSIKLNVPSQTILTTNTSLRARRLPLNTRTLPTFTIAATNGGANVNVTLSASASKGALTLTVSSLASALPNKAKIAFGNGVTVRLTAAAASSATTLAVEAIPGDIPTASGGLWNAGALTVGSMFLPVVALTTDLDVGEILNFTGGNKVTVTDYMPIGSTVLDVLPLTTAVNNSDAASTIALLMVAGMIDANPSGKPKVVDATNLASGVGMEKRVTAVEMTMNANINLTVDDKGTKLIMQQIYDPTYFNYEMYVNLLRPFDGLYEGACILTDGTQSGGVQDIAKQATNMAFQSTSFKRTDYALLP